jgi:gentisate 1,2-dioxygenase
MVRLSRALDRGPTSQCGRPLPFSGRDWSNKMRCLDPVFAKWANVAMTSQQVVLLIRAGMKMLPPGFASHPDRTTQFLIIIIIIITHRLVGFMQ